MPICSGPCAAAAATSASSRSSSSGCIRSARRCWRGLIVYPFDEAKAVLDGYRKFVADGARGAEGLDGAAPGAAAAVPAAPRCTARKSIVLALLLHRAPDAGRRAGRAAAQLRHAGRRARRRRSRTPVADRPSIRCSRRARATTGSRTTSRSSTTALIDARAVRCHRPACRRRNARSSSAHLGGAGQPAGARTTTAYAHRDARVRDERARPLARRRPTTERCIALGARVLRGAGAATPPAGCT